MAQTFAVRFSTEAEYAQALRTAEAVSRKVGIAAQGLAGDILQACVTDALTAGSDTFSVATLYRTALRAYRGRDGETFRSRSRSDSDTFALSLDTADADTGSTLADTLADSDRQVLADDTAETATILVPVDGQDEPDTYTLYAPNGTGCAADLQALVLYGPDDTLVATGEDALNRAYALRQAGTRQTGHGASAQSIAAVAARDAVILATEGMPWQDALAYLAERGITLGRGAHREALRVARKRAAGGTARG